MEHQAAAAAPSAARVEIRTWPGDSSIAHVVLLDVAMHPSHADVRRWTETAMSGRLECGPSDTPIGRVRTGALFTDAASAFADHGYRVVDRLALLERPLHDHQPRPTRPSGVSLRRLRGSDLDLAADIDAEAFPTGWCNDAASLRAIRAATPTSLGRLAVDRRDPIGFALTGRAGTTGYLQRFAVTPAARRRGVARLLVADSLRWLSRRGATKALVNTGVDNDAAFALYESCGFRARSEHLVVMEWQP